MQQQKIYAPIAKPTYRSEESYKKMISLMEKVNFTKDKMKILKEEIVKDPYYLSQEQLTGIQEQFSFTKDKMEVLQVADKYFTEMTTEDVIAMIKNISFSKEKLDTLEILVDFLIDADEENKEKIIAEYTFTKDKEKAREILERARKRNFIYGTVTERVATFLIDVSGSMGQKFKGENGVTYTRLEYVKAQLKDTIDQQLRDFQKFNIITIDSKATQWSADNVDANEANKQAALKWIDGLKPSGGTNIEDAITRAFNTKEQLEAIYTLSDGCASVGVTNVQKMLDIISKRQAERNVKVRIHCTNFMIGGWEKQNDRNQAIQMLEGISLLTSGSFKNIV